MTQIEQMIKDMCPNGVEWKYLTDVANVLYGYPFEAEKFSEDESNIPLIRIRDVVPAKASTYYTGTYPKEYIIKAGDILVGMDGNFNLEKWKDRDGLLNQRVCKIYSKNADAVLDNFLYHLLKPLFKKIEDEIKGGTVKHLSAARIKQIEIPIPPLEIQKKIVECLDKFSALAAELQAELHLRRKQYEYYRTQLLTPHSDCNSADNTDDCNWEWKTLGEIGKVCMCKRILKNETNSQRGIPFYKIGTFGGVANAYISKQLYEEYKQRYSYPKKGDILISAAGTIGKSVIFDGEPSYFQDSNIVWIANNEKKVLNKYLYYYYQIVDWKVDDGGVIKRLYNDNLRATPIAYPSLEEQARIVAILDKFEALTTSLSDGIPAEQAAQQKRYEYYRDKLLTFPKAEK